MKRKLLGAVFAGALMASALVGAASAQSKDDNQPDPTNPSSPHNNSVTINADISPGGANGIVDTGVDLPDAALGGIVTADNASGDIVEF